jgi:hypothetical protein
VQAKEALTAEEEEASVVEWGGKEGLSCTGEGARDEGDEEEVGSGGGEIW